MAAPAELGQDEPQQDRDERLRAASGLAGFAAFGFAWIDPLAGFVIAYFAVREGREAWEGELPD